MERREFITISGLAVAGLAVGCGGSMPVFNDKSFLTGDLVVDKYIELVKYAAMAPSGHNTQPWIFKISKDQIIIVPDMTRTCPAVDPDDRELYISLGCALENLLIASEQHGYKCAVEFIETGERTEIAVTPVKENTTSSGLFEYIQVRQCNRSEYLDLPIKESIKNEIKSMETAKPVFIKTIFEKREMNEIIKLVKEGNSLQIESSEFMAELISWIRFNDGEIEKFRDGLASKCMGQASAPRWLGKLFINLFFSAGSQNDKDEKNILSSGGVTAFLSEEDNKVSWIKTGQLYQKFVLTLAKHRLTTAFINQPCEVKELRSRLAKAIGFEKTYPQLLIRFGYAEKVPFSVRRDVKDVIKLV